MQQFTVLFFPYFASSFENISNMNWELWEFQSFFENSPAILFAIFSFLFAFWSYQGYLKSSIQNQISLKSTVNQITFSSLSFVAHIPDEPFNKYFCYFCYLTYSIRSSNGIQTSFFQLVRPKKQKRMGSLSRSEEMRFCQLIVEKDAAFNIVAEIGKQPYVQFKDVSWGSDGLYAIDK